MNHMVTMDKVYMLCYKSANEIEDIRIFLNFDAVIEHLNKYKKSRQVLEYNVVDGVASELPVAAYYFNGDALVKHIL